MYGIWRSRIISSNVALMFFMPYCYRSSWLPYIGPIACFTFYFVCTSWICVVWFLWQLLVCSVGGSEGYINIGFFYRLVTFLTKGLWYLNVIHFLSSFCFVCCSSFRMGLFFCLDINFFFRLWIVCVYANLKFSKSRLVTKQSKLKLYRTVIRPIVTYASETWILKEAIIQKLLVFERKILSRIFGPTKENQTWRVKPNEELDKLIKHKNIINHIKAQRLSWFLVTYKGCQIPEQLRRYLIGNLWPKDHKEDPSTDGRITSHRTSAKWRSKTG